MEPDPEPTSGCSSSTPIPILANVIFYSHICRKNSAGLFPSNISILLYGAIDRRHIIDMLRLRLELSAKALYAQRFTLSAVFQRKALNAVYSFIKIYPLNPGQILPAGVKYQFIVFTPKLSAAHTLLSSNFNNTSGKSAFYFFSHTHPKTFRT